MIEDIFIKASEFDSKDKELVKNHGVVFTNRKICDRIIKKLSPKITDTVCEPSVGKGVFVFSLLEYFRKTHSIQELKIFVENNLFCYDINQDFIDVFKNLLTKYFNSYNVVIDKDNIECVSYLDVKNRYDIILGNPPYVRVHNIDKDSLDEYKDLKCIELGLFDMYHIFIEKSLKEADKIGFIVPNSFIKNKSGEYLRSILKSRLSYLLDFETTQVWSDISTYTCILTCDKSSEEFHYETRNKSKILENNILSGDKWIFQKQEVKNNSLYDLVDSHTMAIQAGKEFIFKIDNCDDEYCYIQNNKVEKNICQNIVKATKAKSWDDRFKIIYPYDLSSVIEENELKEKYPLCYEYFISQEIELKTRDKGKIEKYDAWYSYSRKQGLLKEDMNKKIILPLTFLRSRGIHWIEIPKGEDSLVLSGIKVSMKEENFPNFLNTICSEDFYEYCYNNNKIKILMIVG
jgi:adenine-specific DNA-methyltransferase